MELFIKRGPVRMILRMIYKILRVFQISVWFYFLPIIALLGSYIVPFLIQHSYAVHAAGNMTTEL